MAKVFTANFPGVCATCNERFQAGTKVTYDKDGDLVEAECPEAEGQELSEAVRAKARATMCGSCFLVHAGECY